KSQLLHQRKRREDKFKRLAGARLSSTHARATLTDYRSGGVTVRASAMCSHLLQFRVLCLCLLENGNVGVGVFPEGEEILIGCARLGDVTLQGVCASKVEMAQCTDGPVLHNPAMVEDLLELGYCFAALMRGQICFSSHVDGVQTARCPKLIGRDGLKKLNGIGRIVVVEREQSANRRQVAVLNPRVFRELLRKVIRQRLGAWAIASEGQR